MNKATIIGCLWIAFASVSVSGQDIPEKVLFVGNSYTYFWNLPQNVTLLAEASDINLKAYQSTAGGSNWGHHWRGERNLKTVDLIKEGDFDALVLQNHSMSAIERKDSVMHYGQLMAQIAKSKGATVYLYQTWAREWDPYMQEAITSVYNNLGEKINARIVPVGLAWERARQLRPELKLYDEDGSHPSSLGTYLAACVFYGVLTQKSPVGLPGRLMTTDKDGQKLYINIQSNKSALFCQKVAEEIINKTID